MSDVQYTSFYDFLEKEGIIAKAEADLKAKSEAIGEERKAIDIAKNMIELRLPLETIVSATKLEVEKVKALYQVYTYTVSK